MGYAMAAALAGCATPQPPAPAEVRPAETTAPQTIESQPLKYLAKRKLAPMPDRAINIKTSCKFRDQTGYRGHLDLQVRDDEVRRFSAEVDIPKRGSCHFDLKNFRQASGRPVALQTASDDACVVRVWEQQNRVTVAFRDCQAQCSGDSFDYLWPILVDAPTGKCS
jgi:hypothetical protein